MLAVDGVPKEGGKDEDEDELHPMVEGDLKDRDDEEPYNLEEGVGDAEDGDSEEEMEEVGRLYREECDREEERSAKVSNRICFTSLRAPSEVA